MGGIDGYGMMDQGGGIMIVWTLLLLVVIGVCVAVGYALLREPRDPRTLESGAARLLDRRLASGEIDDGEYLRRRSTLESR